MVYQLKRKESSNENIGRKYKLLSLSIFLALKNISKNKKAAVLTLFIISLGFISSIIIYGLILDVKFVMEQNFIDTFVGYITIEPIEKGEKIKNVDNIIKKIENLPEIEGIASIQKRAGRLYDKKGDYISGEIWIINPDDYLKASAIEKLHFTGDFLNRKSYGEMSLGCSNIKSCSSTPEVDAIDSDIGETINVFFSSGETENFSLVGVYKQGLSLVEQLIFINQLTAENIFEDYDPNEADFIIIRLPNRDLTDHVIKEISFLGIGADISGWKEKAVVYSETIKGFEVVGNMSFSIGIIISVITVYIILYINILNKRVQIGIIRAIGIETKIISLSYIIQGLFYGIFGSFLGILLTLLMIGYFTLNPIVTNIGKLTPMVNSQAFFWVSITIVISSVLAGYWVSRRIIKQNILNSILNLE
jgi:putative ABC transport system permease protein